MIIIYCRCYHSNIGGCLSCKRNTLYKKNIFSSALSVVDRYWMQSVAFVASRSYNHPPKSIYLGSLETADKLYGSDSTCTCSDYYSVVVDGDRIYSIHYSHIITIYYRTTQ